MKRIVLIPIIAIFVFNACTKENDLITNGNQIGLEEELSLSEQKLDVMLSPEGYLIFKNYEVYDSINQMVYNMTNEEFLVWENKLKFESAQTFILNASAELDLAQTLEEYNAIKNKYCDKLLFTDDMSVRLPFYATAWSRVLNIDGIMKIRHTLFKFDSEKEYMIYDGKVEDLENLETLSNDTTRVRIYEPLKSTKLKSAIAGTFSFPVIYNDDNDRRLNSSLQTIINYYTGYGWTSTYYTEMWLEFRLDMLQEKKKLFGWSNNETVYCVSNGSLHYEYNEQGEFNVNTGPFPNYQWGDLIVFNQAIAIPTISSTEMKGTCVYRMLDYYQCTHGYHPMTDLFIYNLDLDYWSRGIEYDNRKQLRGYDNY